MRIRPPRKPLWPMRRIISTPSISGMLRSHTTTLNCSARRLISSSASRPLRAEHTSPTPMPASIWRICSSTTGSSSTTSTDATRSALPGSRARGAGDDTGSACSSSPAACTTCSSAVRSRAIQGKASTWGWVRARSSSSPASCAYCSAPTVRADERCRCISRASRPAGSVAVARRSSPCAADSRKVARRVWACVELIRPSTRYNWSISSTWLSLSLDRRAGCGGKAGMAVAVAVAVTGAGAGPGSSVVPSQRRMSTARPSSEIGLDKRSSMPAARQRRRSSPITAALCAMIGICPPTRASSSRMLRASAKPSITGMSRSLSTRSKRPAFQRSSAMAPSPTTSASQPRLASCSLSTAWLGA
jgi:hypothetical protein